MAGNDTVLPLAKRSLPSDVSVTRDFGSMWPTSSRQASSVSSACTCFEAGPLFEKLPIRAMPIVPVLNPAVCDPTTFLSTPP